MIKVYCTVVFILSSGYRQVEQLDGVVLKDNNNTKILVDFGDAVPVEPTARWVDENACQYYEDPSKVYGQNNALNEFINKYRIGLRRMLEKPVRKGN